MTDETGMILMARGNVQEMFDIIVGSLDFGSGFLYEEQIQMLRAVAVQLGVNPMVATPSDRAKAYPHRFEAFGVWTNALQLACRFCSSDSKAMWHQEAVS